MKDKSEREINELIIRAGGMGVSKMANKIRERVIGTDIFELIEELQEEVMEEITEIFNKRS